MEIKGQVLLRGYRGSPPADQRALREALLRVSALLELCPEIQEMDINPVRVQQTGLCVLDARIRVNQPAVAQTSRRISY